MIEVLEFVLKQVIKFLHMLFSIDIGHSMDLGTLMCVCFIFLPLVLFFVSFLKNTLIEELDERYDESRRSKYRTYIGKHEKGGRNIYRGKHESTGKTYRGKHEFMGKHGRY